MEFNSFGASSAPNQLEMSEANPQAEKENKRPSNPIRAQRVSKKPKLFGCAACPWSQEKEQMFVEPVIFGDKDVPDLIVIAEAPGRTELAEGEPLVGKSGSIIREISSRMGITVLLANSAQCFNKNKPNAEVIKACRDAYVRPILDQFAGVPILACGEFAASSLLGGNRAIGGLAGKCLEVSSHSVYFTYHPAYYLRSRDQSILEHIKTMMQSSVASIKDCVELPHITHLPPPKSLLDSPYIYIDIETTNELFPWYGSSLICAGLMGNEDNVVYMVNKEDVRNLSFLDHYDGVLVGHNVNFDLVHWFYLGRRFDCADIWDTMIYEKLRPLPEEMGVGLKWLLKKRFGWPGYEAKVRSVIDVSGETIDKADQNDLFMYNSLDVCGTRLLHRWQIDDISKNPNKHIFELSMDYLKEVLKIEMNGFHLSEEKLTEFGKSTIMEIERVEKEIEKITALPLFNPRSTAQIRKFLEKCNINLPDTKESTLESHRNSHKLIPCILELRRLDKWNNTYCAWDRDNNKRLLSKSYNRWIDSNALIHSTMGTQGTETGRCNSRHPNIQNTIPAIRGCFTSRYSGGKLICVDESSLEYRLIAHESRDKRLLEAFRSGGDIHKEAAKFIFGYSDNMTKEQRKEGKTLNYAAVYGCSEDTFYTLIGRKDKEAFEKIKFLYPDVNKWKEFVTRSLIRSKTVKNMFGRTRVFKRVGESEEREAFNWLMQSAGHDILKIHVIEIGRRLKEEGLVRCLLVHDGHDSAIYDTASEEVKEASNIINNVSNNLNSLIEKCFGVKMLVPIEANVEIAEFWT